MLEVLRVARRQSLNLQLCFLKSLFERVYVNAFFDASNFADFCALFPCS
jgi:hypothetical protein